MNWWKNGSSVKYIVTQVLMLKIKKTVQDNSRNGRDRSWRKFWNPTQTAITITYHSKAQHLRWLISIRNRKLLYYENLYYDI